MNMNSAMDYVFILVAVLLIVPILVNYVMTYILQLSGIALLVSVPVVTFVVIFLLKQAMKEDYPEVFESFSTFLITFAFAAIILYAIKDMLSMGVITVITTLLAMIIAYVGPEEFLDAFRDIIYRIRYR